MSLLVSQTSCDLRVRDLISEVRRAIDTLGITPHEMVSLGAALMSIGVGDCDDCSEDMAYKILRGMFEDDLLN